MTLKPKLAYAIVKKSRPVIRINEIYSKDQIKEIWIDHKTEEIVRVEIRAVLAKKRFTKEQLVLLEKVFK